jgi:hypothetical protein
MNPNTYEVKCLEAKYNPEHQMMVLNCVFLYSGERKIVIFSRDDVVSLLRMGQLDDGLIHSFASSLSKRKDPFKMVIEDDPDTVRISPEEEVEYASMFSKQIGEELSKVCEGLADETSKMKRKLGNLLEDGKIDAVKLLEEEKVLRGKIG